MNDGPQQYVLRRAYADLRRWVAGGAAPAKGEPISLTGHRPSTATPAATPSAASARRRSTCPSPPTRACPGSGAGGVFCFLFGDDQAVRRGHAGSLYPTHDDYVAKVTAATDRAVSAGFITDYDAAAIVDAARSAPIPS